MSKHSDPILAAARKAGLFEKLTRSGRAPPDAAELAGLLELRRAARADVRTIQSKRQMRRVICAQCGRGPATGAKLSMCARCRAVNYCSPACQKEHYRASGHKMDCLGFVDPPYAKRFDPSNRGDVPWPVDPVFGVGHQEGIGLWLAAKSGVDSKLQRSFDRPDRRVIPVLDVDAPQSYKSWAGIDGRRTRPRDAEHTKRAGRSLFALQIVVQNRRTDGRAVVLDLGQQMLITDDALRAHAEPSGTTAGPDGAEALLYAPWTDYNGELRATIVEINGTESPVGWFDPAPNGEFKHPPEPRSAPWDRVLSWPQRRVLLGPGDYVVANLQWLVGDAREYKVYPKIMLLTYGTVAKTRLLDTTAAQPGWVERAKKEVAQRGLSAIQAVDVVAYTDRAAMLEFYTPYFENGPDAFADSRFGGCAKMYNAHVARELPKLLEGIFQHLEHLEHFPPDVQATMKRKHAENTGFSADDIWEAIAQCAR